MEVTAKDDQVPFVVDRVGVSRERAVPFHAVGPEPMAVSQGHKVRGLEGIAVPRNTACAVAGQRGDLTLEVGIWVRCIRVGPEILPRRWEVAVRESPVVERRDHRVLVCGQRLE
jgi:hypothetical protein